MTSLKRLEISKFDTFVETRIVAQMSQIGGESSFTIIILGYLIMLFFDHSKWWQSIILKEA